MKNIIRDFQYGDENPEYQAPKLSENAVDMLNEMRNGKLHLDMNKAPVPTALESYDLYAQFYTLIKALTQRIEELEKQNQPWHLDNSEQVDESGVGEIDFNHFSPEHKVVDTGLANQIHKPTEFTDIGCAPVHKILDHLLLKRAPLPGKLSKALPGSITNPPTQAEVVAINDAVQEIQDKLTYMSNR